MMYVKILIGILIVCVCNISSSHAEQVLDGLNITPKGLYVSLESIEKNDQNFLIITKDTPLYTNRHTRGKKVIETPDSFQKGSVLSFKRWVKIADFYAYEVQGGLIPQSSAAKLTTVQVEQIIDFLYPQVNEKSKSLGAVRFRSFPLPTDNDWVRGGFSDNENTDIDVLRCTRNGKWYYIRFWKKNSNIWLKGWVPAESIQKINLPQIAQITDQDPANISYDTEQIAKLYGLPLYADIALRDLHEQRVAITLKDTPTYVYERHGRKKPEATPYIIKEGTLFGFRKSPAQSKLQSFFQSSLWLDGSRRSLFIPEDNAKIVSSVDVNKVFDVLYPPFFRHAMAIKKSVLKLRPYQDAKDSGSVIKKNENIILDILRRTDDYQWYYISFWTRNYFRKDRGWVLADSIRFLQDTKIGEKALNKTDTNDNLGMKFIEGE